jgi:hypothetical protein
MTRILRSRDALAMGFLIAWPFVYFWQITLGQGVWFGSDILRRYYPLGVELARALNEGRLPLWTTSLSAGFPLLAEMEIGALYPINLLLYRFLPAQFALSFGMLLHLAWAGCGMYALARSMGLRVSSALLAGLVFSFSGFMFSRIVHPTILLNSSWLAWLIFFQDQFQKTWNQKKPTAAIWFCLTVLSIGIQFLSGSPQIAFLNLQAVALVGLFGGLLWNHPDAERQVFDLRAAITPIPQVVLWTVLPIVLGMGSVAIQLLPTTELIGYSGRSGTPDFNFITSGSLPPEFLTQFLFPLLHGEPTDGTNNEYWAYLGVLPFVLAVMAPFLRRERRTIFFGLLALGALSLALGDVNPAYILLYRLPGFSFFRVPARYLLLFVFAAALLSAFGFEALSQRLMGDRVRVRTVAPWSIAFALLTLGAMWLSQTQLLDFWLNVWRASPIVLIAVSLGITVLAWKQRIERSTFQSITFGLTVFDLASLAPVFVITLGQIQTPAYVASVPRSLSVLDSQPDSGRVYTDPSSFVSLPAMRASLYPNLALVYEKQGVGAYSSLGLSQHAAYLSDASAVMLNLMNVHYIMVPLEPRPETSFPTPSGSVGLDVLNNEAVIAPTMASGIELSTFTERAENLSDGNVLGEVELRRSDGRIESFPLRLGSETADWDYARTNPSYALPTVTHSFTGFWRSFGREFDGHTYVAHFTFDPGEILGVNIKTLRAEERLTVESVYLCKEGECNISLAKLTGKDDFSLAYMSDTVAAWENLDALPRAFIVHTAEIADDNAVLGRLQNQQLQTGSEVLLSADTTPRDRVLQEAPGAIPAHDAVQITSYQSQDAKLSVSTDRAGYLVLADTWYPGWSAFVDGQPMPISRANLIFRAVPIEAGAHSVTFEYRPTSFIFGGVISAISLVITLVLAWGIRRSESAASG